MPNTPDTPSRGGKRTGAGRKAISAAPRAPTVSVTLTPDDIAFLRSIDDNLSKAIRTLIAQARRSSEATQ